MTPMPISKNRPLVLGSRSPRRKMLLEQLHIPFRVIPGRRAELPPEGDPESSPRLLAEQKAKEVYALSPGSWVLGADTIVTVDGLILGKPRDHADAMIMLRRLSNKEHRVVTGFTLINPQGETAHGQSVATRVRFRELTEREIRDYVDTGEPLGKAGAYAIQGIGAFAVCEIRGSYTNVVGLPLCALVGALCSVGALSRFPLSPGAGC